METNIFDKIWSKLEESIGGVVEDKFGNLIEEKLNIVIEREFAKYFEQSKSPDERRDVT